MSITKKYRVASVTSQECKPFLLQKHYLKRMTSISYGFGLYDGINLIGICTFGNAIPTFMKKSICGEEYMDFVYELNRLCVMDNIERNARSYFVSQCLKLLPKPTIIVSYADSAFGHHGYIYQALNFYYTGLSHTQMDWKLKGREHIHSRTLMDEFAFEKDRITKLKEKYGDLLYQEMRKPKHRYVMLLGSKSQKNKIWKNKLFNLLPYPKGNNTRYDTSKEIITQTSFL